MASLRVRGVPSSRVRGDPSYGVIKVRGDPSYHVIDVDRVIRAMLLGTHMRW